MPSDLLTARLIERQPPLLPPALRDNLARGLRATIRRDEYRLSVLAPRRASATAALCFTLMERIAACRADLAELEAL